jgi:hypothetical protein
MNGIVRSMVRSTTWRAGVSWVAFEAIANNAGSDGWPLRLGDVIGYTVYKGRYSLERLDLVQPALSFHHLQFFLNPTQPILPLL